jgi:two-component system, LuxR family, response regulator FixJ
MNVRVREKTMETEPKVFIVDDDESVGRGLVMLCKSEGLQAESFTGAFQFLSEYDPGQPGCLILDIRMHDMDGIALQRKLQEKNLNIPVIAISGHANIPIAVEAMKLGAVDFVEKPFSSGELLKLIRIAIRQDIAARQKAAGLEQARQSFSRLSEREKEVLECIYNGHSNKSIAQELGVSHKTIEFHRKNIMEKMQAESIVELIQVMDTLATAQN